MKTNDSDYFKYVVFTRYEVWGPSGKKFTKWFTHSQQYDDKDEAVAEMKRLKENSDWIDKKMKLKHEYEVRHINKTLLYQSKMHVGKGRYKKVSELELDRVAENVEKTGDAVIDSSIGAYVYNTQGHRDYISGKIDSVKSGENWVRFWYDRDNGNAVHAILMKTDVSVYDF